MNTHSLTRAVRQYVGKIRTMRNEIRTERFMNSLPADIAKDIGWPDRFGVPLGRRTFRHG